MLRARFVALACALFLPAAPMSASAANQLNVLKPAQGQVFAPGDTILVQARPNAGVQLPTLQVEWDIQCTSCGNPPTSASVFTQPDLTMPQPGYDVTSVLGPGTYRARVKLYPDQPGWTWSDWRHFTWATMVRPPLVHVPAVQKYPYPKIPNPGPERTMSPMPQELPQGH